MARPLSPVARGLVVETAWAQILGRREEQQDAASITRWDNGFHLLIVADGMGGHAGGAEASRIAANGMKQGFIETTAAPIRQRLLAGLQTANDAMFDFAESHPDLDGLGSTILAVTFDGDSIEWISVGDSPLWLVRDGEIRRLNANHSMAGLLDQRVARGEISAAEAEASPKRSQLLEAVMGHDIELIDQSDQPLELVDDDIVILASDGIERLSTADIARIVTETGGAAAQRVDRLLAAVEALDRPRQDNATVALAHFTADQLRPATFGQPQ